MVANLALLSNLLFASAALADSSSQLEAHRHKDYQSRSSGFQPHTDSGTYSGAVWNYPGPPPDVPTSQGNFTIITGTFQVPYLQEAPESGLFAMVMVDLLYQCKYNFQAGLDMRMSEGVASYFPWCGWAHTELACNFTGMVIQTGDNVTVTINITSPTALMVMFEDLTCGENYVQQFIAPTENALCLNNFGWLVGYANGITIPMANFGILKVRNAIGSIPYFGSFTPMDITIVDMAVHPDFSMVALANGSDLVFEYLPPQ